MDLSSYITVDDNSIQLLTVYIILIFSMLIYLYHNGKLTLYVLFKTIVFFTTSHPFIRYLTNLLEENELKLLVNLLSKLI